MKEEIQNYMMTLQDSICKELEIADGKSTFQEEIWERAEGGGGRTRVIKDGKVIEKGGVNFSAVYGETPQKILEALKLEKADFFATGVSIVLHPHNPFVPIIHMNVRYFEMTDGTYWFGGGIDLTPHYVQDEDAIWFHTQLKNACDKHNLNFYPKFKNWADDYFYIPHRSETRGVGGIFFDHLKENESMNKRQIFEFVKEIGGSFAGIYTHFMNKNASKSFEENHKKWQHLRRGRYVEFNLVYDKGTKFGLDTNGRTESILMSLPPVANWDYNVQVENESEEAYTLSKLEKGIDWV